MAKNEDKLKPVKRYRMQPIAAKDLSEQLTVYSRAPFADFLREALENGPTPQSIADLADRSPVAWSDYLIKLAKLYGYQESSTINHNHRLVETMSDIEIAAELQSLDDKRAAIDVSPIDISLNKL